MSKIVVQLLVFAASATVNSAQPLHDYRLGDSVVPSHYDLWLRPYFTAEVGKPSFTFDGNVKIVFRPSLLNLQQIVLHANQLTINDDWLVYEEDFPAVIVPRLLHTYDEATHKLNLNLISYLSVDRNYVLEINFSGQMNNNMVGFYKSSYTANGVTHWLGATQFESTDARRAFPCFDEPKFKATFKVTIDRPSSFAPTLSNTYIESRAQLSPTLVRETFKVTPIMPTYLVAFVVSNFQGERTPNMMHGIYTPPYLVNQTTYGLQFAEEVFQKLDEFTNFPIFSVPDLEKMDHVVIPDFFAGGMENFGLITYRSTSFLFHTQHSTAINKNRVAAVIAHEAAHHWFGNIVTCEWWDVAWLNEGYSRYLEYFGALMVEPNWELDLIYPVEQIHSVFQLDSLDSTHPMTYEVNTPGEASDIFDNISYNKGSAIVRMMAHLIGHDQFRLATQDYLRDNALSSARPDHLWTAMQNRAPDLQVARIMEPWTTQAGYPYITVKVNGTFVWVTQKRFLLKNKDHSETTTWPIPLSFALKESDFADTKPKIMFYQEDGATKVFILPEVPESYFIVNNQQTGYYRVNYDTENWQKIKAELLKTNHGGIHVSNRAQIVDDLFNFARAGILEYDFAFQILEYMTKERHYVAWLAFFNGLSHLEKRFGADIFKNYVLTMLESIYEHTTFYPRLNDTQTQIYTRNNVLAWLCRYGHEDCLKNSKYEYDKFIESPSTYLINPDHRAVVYCEGIRVGNATDFEILWQRFLATVFEHEKSTILNSLGCSKAPTLIQKLLSATLTDSIRYQDKNVAFQSTLSGNPENVDVVFEYVTANYKAWSENFSFNGMGDVSSAISSIADRFTKIEQVVKLDTFLIAHEGELGPGPSQGIRRSIKESLWQFEWTDDHIAHIQKYFTKISNAAYSIHISALASIVSLSLALLLFKRNLN